MGGWFVDGLTCCLCWLLSFLIFLFFSSKRLDKVLDVCFVCIEYFVISFMSLKLYNVFLLYRILYDFWCCCFFCLGAKWRYLSLIFLFYVFFCINFNIIFDFSNGTYFTRIPFICQPSSLCFHRIFIYKILFTAEFEIYDTWYSCSCQGIIKCVLILIESDFFSNIIIIHTCLTFLYFQLKFIFILFMFVNVKVNVLFPYVKSLSFLKL